MSEHVDRSGPASSASSPEAAAAPEKAPGREVAAAPEEAAAALEKAPGREVAAAPEEEDTPEATAAPEAAEAAPEATAASEAAGAEPRAPEAAAPAALPESVERWETAGGTWRVAAVGEGSAVVDLLRCDGGECVERLRLTDPRDVRWARVQRAASTSTMRP